MTKHVVSTCWPEITQAEVDVEFRATEAQAVTLFSLFWGEESWRDWQDGQKGSDTFVRSAVHTTAWQ